MSKMTSVDIVLIAFYDINSLAVLTLHTVLKKQGFNVRSIFFKVRNPNSSMSMPSDKEINVLVQLVQSLAPKLVGINVKSTFFKLAVRITSEIKQKMDTVVVWGGIHPTVRPAQCIEFADTVCIGEGEGAIVELALKLFEGGDISRIRNLWVKKREGVFKNDLRPLIEPLDSVPFPDFFPDDKFIIEEGRVSPFMGLEQQEVYKIMTSRGCFFNCTYCCHSTLRNIYKGKGKSLRRRSVENVIYELAYAKAKFKNLRYIDFDDDIFTFDIVWIKKFCEQYKKNINLPFFCYCQPNMVNEEMIACLKDAGLKLTTIGLQSGSKKIRRYFGRKDSVKEIISASKLLHKYKIIYYYHLISDNPLETDKDKLETLKVLLALPKPFKIKLFLFNFFPETEIVKILLKKGMISENDIEDQKQKSYSRGIYLLDANVGKKNLPWDTLYYLAGKRYVPKGVILWMGRSGFLRERIPTLIPLLRLVALDSNAIRTDSKLDLLRFYMLSFLHNPYLVFKKAVFVLQNMISNRNALLYAKIKVPHYTPRR